MNTSVQVAPHPVVTDDDVITHEVCCLDEEKDACRISMCGYPIPDGEVLEDDSPSCAVCLDLIDQWAHYADEYGEDPTGPDDDPCRCCPRRFFESGSR